MSKAQHPKAASFVRQQLFAGVSSFTELEARIAVLPDEQARGGAFEVFAEAYLATQRKHDAAKIWPLTSVPTQVLQTLGLATQDYGVDGVFQTLLGHFSAYQVKFRTGRPGLTWRELSTFMGLADSPRIRSRVLLTNCDDLPAVLNERQGFFCIRGSDLDRLEADDFRTIEAWLADAAFTAPKKQPQPHQTEALNALLPALETHDRVSAIMACGTGKTLVALWVAEHVALASSHVRSGDTGAARILVLVPSLALLRQILHEWLRETDLPSLAYLCVCSDPTVKDGLDAIATAQSDLDFQVSTDAASVRDFLDTPFNGAKVVFSTYQSAQEVGKALKPGEAFDLGVFDEAHKTAGREGRNYAFALEDDNLPIRKRLFLTATPRHYNPLRKDNEGDAQLVFSMDRPDVYGRQAYRLPFAEAARRGIICGYKIIISVITSEMVTNELLSRGKVMVNGDAVRVRQVANQLALRDAIEKYRVKKVFTFHNTVKSAESFVSDGAEGVGTHLSDVRSPGFCRPGPPEGGTPNFQTFHVKGTMLTTRREREMRDFRAASRAVMSNARCLTEGVDVPAVDMVAFLSPKRSRVDIVQATGRAMRRSPGKTKGYVLVPLYLEMAVGETVESAVNRAEFNEVWDVLQSLLEQDEVLAEIIREMREERGRTKGFDDSRFQNLAEVVGPRILLERLRSAISTACVEVLSDSWEEWFGRLKEFKDRFGHCNVAHLWPENPQLGAWVHVQRRFRKTGKLPEERVRSLDEIGFNWDQRADAWERMFSELLVFKEQHGHCDVPSGWEGNAKLSHWVVNQRGFRKRGKLSDDRVQRLESIQFAWETRDGSWEEMFAELLQFKAKHGHCNVGKVYAGNQKLANWTFAQKNFKRWGKLDQERIRRLEEVGFVWETRGAYWEQMFQELVHYKSLHGNCNVPDKWAEDRALAGWVASQRSAKKRGVIKPERVNRLEDIGFVWNVISTGWESKYTELLKYRQRYGNCDVPANWNENPQLASWIRTQRAAFARGKLNEDCIQRLGEIGFSWNASHDSWEEMFTALLEFKQKRGHCNVPQRQRDNNRLGAWLNAQRQYMKAGKLQAEQIRRLDEVGILWEPHAERWDAMFKLLLKFKREHGHCDVTVASGNNRQLYGWVARQRSDMKRGALKKDRIQRLDEIGFDWKTSAPSEKARS